MRPDCWGQKTLIFDDDGTPLLREIEVPAAEDDDVKATVKVMGGEDWARWIDTMEKRGLIRPGFQTVALSYIGSALTSAITGVAPLVRRKYIWKRPRQLWTHS
jgi:trans-2-enoyl-CoA reductase